VRSAWARFERDRIEYDAQEHLTSVGALHPRRRWRLVRNADSAQRYAPCYTELEALAPVSQRLRGVGKAEVTAQQLENATQAVLQRSVREGRLDREMLTQATSANTALSRVDAEQVAMDAEARFLTGRAAVERQLTSAGHTALAAAEDSSKAFWVLFGALLLGMVAAIGGSVVASDRGRHSARRLAPLTRPAPASGRRAEAYP
jgi:hypothetical protein